MKKSSVSRFTDCETLLYLVLITCRTWWLVQPTDSPRRIWSPNSCDTLPVLCSAPVLPGSCTSIVFNLHTQTHYKYRSYILIIIFQQHRAPSYKHSDKQKSGGPLIRFKLLDSNHILQQTTQSLIGFHFSETLPNNQVPAVDSAQM
jgi:hypothetical protein